MPLHTCQEVQPRHGQQLHQAENSAHWRTKEEERKEGRKEGEVPPMTCPAVDRQSSVTLYPQLLMGDKLATLWMPVLLCGTREEDEEEEDEGEEKEGQVGGRKEALRFLPYFPAHPHV